METCCTNLEQGKSGIAIRLKGEMVTQAIRRKKKEKLKRNIINV